MFDGDHKEDKGYSRQHNLSLRCLRHANGSRNVCSGHRGGRVKKIKRCVSRLAWRVEESETCIDYRCSPVLPAAVILFLLFAVFIFWLHQCNDPNEQTAPK